ncbi:MAG: phosphoribosyltransferase family protein [Flavobacteriales bacterium]
MSQDRTEILNALQVNQKITRIAHEICERHYKSKSLIIVGIKNNGALMAARISTILKEISDLDITTVELSINKRNVVEPITLSQADVSVKNKSVIVVDDVINSGRTLIYAVKHLLDSEPKSLGTVALIDRIHRRFPLGADYVGMTLSTTLKEHVDVELAAGKEGVYLE